MLGLGLMLMLALRSSFAVLPLVLVSCGLGYLYQVHPFAWISGMGGADLLVGFWPLCDGGCAAGAGSF